MKTSWYTSWGKKPQLLLKYVGADLLKMSKEDFVQICGPADGIRLFNAIKGRFVTVFFLYVICFSINFVSCGWLKC